MDTVCSQNHKKGGKKILFERSVADTPAGNSSSGREKRLLN